MNTIKVSLIGDGGVGKTTFVKKLLTGNFIPKYVATMGVWVESVRIPSLSNMCFNVWDCAGQEKFGGLRDGYFIESQACIVMFSITSRRSFASVGRWIGEYQRMGRGPIILCASKSDLPQERRVFKGEIESLGYPYVEISTKNGTNLEKVFQVLNEHL